MGASADDFVDWLSRPGLVAWAVGGVGAILLILILARQQRKPARAASAGPKVEAHSASSLCADLKCIRCRNYASLTENIQERVDAADPLVRCTRIRDAITHTATTATPSATASTRIRDIVRAEEQQPFVFQVSGLTATPWWYAMEGTLPHASPLKSAMEILENPETYSCIFDECSSAFHSFNNQTAWRANTCSQGSWNVLHLVNQGVVQEDVCAMCPKTFEAIGRIPLFMGKCVFGNAFFSVALPGTSITPHCGPTNIRLRCHLALQVPTTGTLCMSVGGIIGGWEEGKCTVFDDSFEHSADVFDDCTEERVVLVVDLWHPDLSDEERIMLERLFPPEAAYKYHDK